MFEIIHHYSWCSKLLFYHDTTAPQWAKNPSSSRIHDRTQTHLTRQDSSGQVISPTQRHLPNNTQHSHDTNIHASGGIRIHNPSKRAAVDPSTRPRDQWDHQYVAQCCLILGPAILGQYFNLQPSASGWAWNSTEKIYCGKYDKIRHKHAHLSLTTSSTLRSNN